MKNHAHPLLIVASLIVLVAGLRAAAPVVSLFLLAAMLATSVSPVVLKQLRLVPVLMAGGAKAEGST